MFDNVPPFELWFCMYGFKLCSRILSLKMVYEPAGINVSFSYPKTLCVAKQDQADSYM